MIFERNCLVKQIMYTLSANNYVLLDTKKVSGRVGDYKKCVFGVNGRRFGLVLSRPLMKRSEMVSKASETSSSGSVNNPEVIPDTEISITKVNFLLIFYDDYRVGTNTKISIFRLPLELLALLLESSCFRKKHFSFLPLFKIS